MKGFAKKIVIASGINNKHTYLSIVGNNITQEKVNDNGTKTIIKTNIETKRIRVQHINLDDERIEMDMSDDIRNCVIDISINGDRWEGAVVNGEPYGWGKLYNEWNNCVYEGFMYKQSFVCYGTEYYSDLSTIQYDGMFYDNHHMGYGRLFDRKGDLISSGCWINNEYSSSILRTYPRCEDTELIHSLLRVIVIGNNSYNNDSMDSLLFANYPHLNKLVIGSYCCKNVVRCEIRSMHCLRTFSVGEYSFFNLKGNTCTFSCKYCSALVRMSFGEKAFGFFHQFNIRGKIFYFCNKVVGLKKLKKISMKGGSFVNSSFILQSIDFNKLLMFRPSKSFDC